MIAERSGREDRRLSASRPQDASASRIADYALLSDCHSAALVGRDGSIDWFCAPRFDSPSVFGRILDAGAGHWSLAPEPSAVGERSYVDNAPVLRTVFETHAGAVAVTDVLVVPRTAEGHGLGAGAPHVIARRVECLSGTVRVVSDLSPRLEYGRTHPHLDGAEGRWRLWAGPTTLRLCSSVPHAAQAGGALRSVFTLHAGESAGMTLQVLDSYRTDPPTVDDAAGTIADTVAAWKSWAAQHGPYRGRYAEQVRRSAMVLQALTYQPSGAVVAAPTTSLPERIGEEWNWDYRFAWLRDLSFVMRSLWIAACPDEPQRFFEWISSALGQLDADRVQIMFGVEGERDLTEHELDHLGGYRDSRPVRLGNDAWRQHQLDVLGEVLDGALLLHERMGAPGDAVAAMLVGLADRAAEGWREPDFGMWEARDKARQYLSSKVMCWVALDRAISLASWLGAERRVATWERERDAIRVEIEQRGWNEDAQAYTGAFDSDRLDASVLLMPLVGFLPATDARMRSTIARIEEQLGSEHGVERWAGEGSGFSLCGFWLSECLALVGETDAAVRRFESTVAAANDLGLLAEETDLATGEPLGNFPQAFSHVGLINAAWRLSQLDTGEEQQ